VTAASSSYRVIFPVTWMHPALQQRCRRHSTTGAMRTRNSRHSQRNLKLEAAAKRSINRLVHPRYRALTSGPMALPTSTTLSLFAKRVLDRPAHVPGWFRLIPGAER